jgi:glutamate carboxypeptidase
MSDTALREAVEAAFENEQVPFMARLVNAPSHTYAPDDVEAAAVILDELAAELGLEITKVPCALGRFADHRVYATPATGDDLAPALVGHVDTVFPRSMGFLEFKRDGDKVFGPGVLDMKSGLSEMLFSLRALREVDPEGYAELKLRVIVVSDEEVGSPSSAALYEELAPKTSFALVFEAGRVEDKIVTCRKGAAGFKISATGRAAHAGNKHKEGVNAIGGLARLIPFLESITDYDRGVTLNVGIMHGGTAKNTVPDHAECVIDVRFLTKADGEKVEAELQELVADPGAYVDMPARLEAVTFALEGGISRPPMEATPEIQALRESYEPHAAAVGIRVGEAPLQGGGSDANLLAAHGVPCVDGLGPEGAHFHKPEEWSSLGSLMKRTQALTTFLASR